MRWSTPGACGAGPEATPTRLDNFSFEFKSMLETSTMCAVHHEQRGRCSSLVLLRATDYPTPRHYHVSAFSNLDISVFHLIRARYMRRNYRKSKYVRGALASPECISGMSSRVTAASANNGGHYNIRRRKCGATAVGRRILSRETKFVSSCDAVCDRHRHAGQYLHSDNENDTSSQRAVPASTESDAELWAARVRPNDKAR